MLRVRLVPWWAWALGGAAMCVALLLLYRAQLQKAEARGYDRAQVECEQAAQAQAEAWAKQVRDADRKAALSIDRLNKAERVSRDRIRAHFRDKPSSCGLSADAIGLLHESDAERAAAYAAGSKPGDRKATAAAKGEAPARGRDDPAD